METKTDSNKVYKEEIVKQWNETPCGSTDANVKANRESLEFFESIRKSRYENSDEWMKRWIPFDTGKGKKLLEIGHGLGTDLLSWCEEGAECFGVDITPEHHRLAKRNFELHGKKANLQIADAANLPFEKEHFDIVFSNGVIHHTPDTVRCISEAYRVLKPGGRFIFTVYRKWSAFHLVYMLFVQGICKQKLRKLGYEGLMATVEQGADGIKIKPLVKTYSKKQLKYMLSDFSDVQVRAAHFKREHLSKIGLVLPKLTEKLLERWLGWYLIIQATK